MIKLFFTGYLTRDPLMETTKKGTAVCNLNIGVRKADSENSPIYVKLAVWGKQGETCGQYLKKGRTVTVTAKDVNVTAYIGKDGNPRFQLSAKAEDVEFGGVNEESKRNDNAEKQEAGEETQSPVDDMMSGFIEVDDSDLPFE